MTDESTQDVLRAQLEEIFAEHPDLRPTEEGIAATLAEPGLRRADDEVS